jgi:hypothetical protein
VSGRATSVACQPFFPREAISGALRPGKDDFWTVWRRRRGLRECDLNPLVAQEADAGSAMLPATPVFPEEGSRTNHQGIEQDAHLTRLFARAPLPLTLLAQRTRVTTANAGRIDHADSHRPLDAAPGGEEAFLLDSGASHRAGEESLAPRSDPSSSRWPWWVNHIQSRALMRLDAWQSARSAARWQAQIRWCVWASVPADAPVPGGGSTPIVPPPASTPAPRPSGCTTDRGRFPYPHLPEQGRKHRDADTPQRRQKQ